MTITSTTTTCRWVAEDQPRMLRSHARDCNTSGCPGCQACPERHCQVCGHEHVTVDGRGTDETCASCIGDTRVDIARITDLSSVMIAAATERGVNSLAALHAGPAANYDAQRHIHRSMVTGKLCRCRRVRGRQCPATLTPASGPTCAPDEDDKLCKHQSCTRIRGELCPDVIAWHEDVRDELHPLWVLGMWDFTVRDHLDQLLDTVGERIDIPAAAAYLDGHLSRLAHDHRFDFRQFAREIRQCRTHLEEVLAVAPYEETGAPCPACGKGHLVKSYGATEDEDRWTCRKCAQWWTEHDYRAKVAGVYVTVAPALTASQIREQYRIPEGTVRRWASGTTPTVRTRGRDGTGRQLYDVSDVLRQRDARSRPGA